MLVFNKFNMSRLSGLQVDVLILYRSLLRTAKSKDPMGVSGLQGFVKQKFRENATSVSRNEFKLIEHLLRHGYKQKKQMEMPGFSTAGSFFKG